MSELNIYYDYPRIGYFMEDGIYRNGKLQPKEKTEIIWIDDSYYTASEEEEVKVISWQQTYYHIKKKEIVLYKE